MKATVWQTLLWSVAALAAVSVGIAAGPLPWRFAGESGVTPPQSASPAEDAAPPVSIEPILSLALFGRIARPLEPVETTEETELGLTLAGVMIADDPAASGAIIAGPSEPARAFAIGEEVTPAATLAEVQGDHVVLLVEGRRETLSFPERSGVGAGVAAMRALVGAPAEPEPEPAPEPDDAQAAITAWGERIADNPQTVLDDLGFEAIEGGYRVGDAAASSVLQAGLQAGDVVAKVNGQQVGDIERDSRFFAEVTASGRARIDVLRDGRRIVLSFPLR